MSSSDTETEDQYYSEDEEITDELKASYKKVKDELYRIRKRQQKPVFDPSGEEPRIVDLLRETENPDAKRYDESSWEDTKFFCVTVFISLGFAAAIYAFLNYVGLYEVLFQIVCFAQYLAKLSHVIFRCVHTQQIFLFVIIMMMISII